MRRFFHALRNQERQLRLGAKQGHIGIELNDQDWKYSDQKIQ
jgi:hypothetical protein